MDGAPMGQGRIMACANSAAAQGSQILRSPQNW